MTSQPERAARGDRVLRDRVVTPPFGATLFYMKGAAPPGVTMSDVDRGMDPFVALRLAGLGLCICYPTIVLWLPELAGLLD
jgi:TRAP-type mannitol/chloroaromatic compound transport system permease large subunit